MDDANLPPLIEEKVPINNNTRTHIVIRTAHGVYAQGTVLKGEEEDWLKANRPLALARLKETYSRSTIPLDDFHY